MPLLPWSHHWRWARPMSAGRSSLVHRRSSGTHHHTPGRCTTGCANPLHTSCLRTLTQRQQRPSSQRTRINGRSVATYIAGWAMSWTAWWRRCCMRWLEQLESRRRWQRPWGPLLDDGQHGAATLDRVQAAAASELVIHNGSCGHIGLLPEVELQSSSFFASSMSDANVSASC
jgi:hypothetical protein